MSAGTSIEWTEATWNPVTGCTRAAPECDHCYAVSMTHRLENMGQAKYAGLAVLNAKGDRHFNGVVRCHEDALTIPLHWRKPRRIFVNSMSDLFHRDVPFEFIDRVFAVMALTPQHTYQLLTKRPDRMADYTNRSDLADEIYHTAEAEAWGELGNWGQFDRQYDECGKVTGRPAILPLPNVHLYFSAGTQKFLDWGLPFLLKCPAAVRGLSCEPLIGPIRFSMIQMPTSECRRQFLASDGTDPLKIDHVIIGGESGPRARPSRLEWHLSIINQCRAAGVPVFWKQWGSVVRLGYYHEHDVLRERVLDMRHKIIVPTREGGAYEHDTRIDGQPPLESLIEAYPGFKGGDWSEWPEDLRVREMPEVRA